MGIKERVRACRLVEKINTNPQIAEGLGVCNVGFQTQMDMANRVDKDYRQEKRILQE